MTHFTIYRYSGEFVMNGRTTDVQAINIPDDCFVVLAKIDPNLYGFDQTAAVVVKLPEIAVSIPELKAGVETRVPVAAGVHYDCKGGFPIHPADGEIVLNYPEPGEYPINLGCQGFAMKTIIVKVMT